MNDINILLYLEPMVLAARLSLVDRLAELTARGFALDDLRAYEIEAERIFEETLDEYLPKVRGHERPMGGHKCLD